MIDVTIFQETLVGFRRGKRSINEDKEARWTEQGTKCADFDKHIIYEEVRYTKNRKHRTTQLVGICQITAMIGSIRICLKPRLLVWTELTWKGMKLHKNRDDLERSSRVSHDNRMGTHGTRLTAPQAEMYRRRGSYGVLSLPKVRWGSEWKVPVLLQLLLLLLAPLPGCLAPVETSPQDTSLGGVGDHCVPCPELCACYATPSPDSRTTTDLCTVECSNLLELPPLSELPSAKYISHM